MELTSIIGNINAQYANRSHVDSHPIYGILGILTKAE